MQPKYLWIDLETTGLDRDGDLILEVAAVVTGPGPAFEQHDSYQAVVLLAVDLAIAKMDDYVFKMHTRNNLIADLGRGGFSLVEIQDQLMEMCASFDDAPILAGSSPHFDRGFIQRRMPRLHKKLSHRHYDVSTLKMACVDMGQPFEKTEAHRAMPDILESIAHAKMSLQRLAYQDA